MSQAGSETMTVIPHSPAWYDRLAQEQVGYYYPWQSLLPPLHGEDLFLQMVKQHVSPELDVLEVACAHGELTLALAPLCRSILGYDRVAAWIERAQSAAAQHGFTNARFACHNSSSEANGGQPRLPALADSFDLLICSKGPFHWIEDARRVARSNAVLLMLVPDSTPLPTWHSQLPVSLQWQAYSDPHWAKPAIEQRLAVGGLELDSWWSFDVPEIFPNPEQLYVHLSWGKTISQIPTFIEVRPILDHIFHAYGSDEGVAIRHFRYIWKAIATK